MAALLAGGRMCLPPGKRTPVTEPRPSGTTLYVLVTKPRLEKVTDGLFEREEAVLHVMGWGGGRRGCAETRTRERGRSPEK